MPAPYNHSSGLPGAYDRTPDKPDWTGLIFREDRMGQAAELNELQSMLGLRGRRIGNLVARDGDRVQGADVVVDVGAGTVSLTAGKIYVNGDVRDVDAAVLNGVPMTGEVKVGVRIVNTVITEVEDTSLLGLHVGSEAEGEPGAAREVQTIQWGRTGDLVDGDLYAVFLLKDGTIIDQTPPPVLGGISQQLAVYDRDAHGNYIVQGCRVTAIGKIGSAQHFGISEGVANINGFKRTRFTSIRHVQAEEFDTRLISAEPHTFPAGGVIFFNNAPLATLNTAIVTKEKTVSVTKGTSNTMDNLPDSAVTSIVSVVQGGTTYVAGTSYNLTADKVDWSPGGAEPANGTSYNVTYRYFSPVTPSSVTDTSVTLAGGVEGGAVLLTYTHKVPRVDLLCLNDEGISVYLKGLASVTRPKAPEAPSNMLALAEIHNDWTNIPTVKNADIRSIPYKEFWHYLRRLADLTDLVALERLRSDIDNREPVAKKGVFVDPFVNDFYRDAGETQTAAIFDGNLELAIDPTFYRPTITAPICLDNTDEIVVRQELTTQCSKINPYVNFSPLPGVMELTPSADFWTEFRTDWLSPITREIAGVVDQVVVDNRIEQERTDAIPMLRTIPVSFTLRGFGAGEILSSLTFDGVVVTPAGPPVANGSGIISGSFTIPANVPAGTKAVEAIGAGGSFARAQFVGAGSINVTVMRRVTTIFNAPEPPPPTIPDWDPAWGRQDADPIAQTFSLVESRHINGIDLKWCAKGDEDNHCLVQLRTVELGLPTREVIAEAFVDMAAVVLNAWTEVRFNFPVFLFNDREYAFVILTDDADHALATAQVGDFDAAKQEFVAAQPYSVGVMLTSSNARTWTPHQDEDLTFRIVAAAFSPVEKTVNLGTFALTNCSDIVVRGVVELPTSEASFQFEIERADGSKTRLLPGQSWQLSEYVTENVILRGILKGSAKISPVLYPGVLMIAGSIRSSGTYITKVFDLGTAVRMSNFYKALLPSGSSVTVEIDKADDSWTTVAVHATTVLDQGFVEREHRVTPYTADEGRLRVTLAGTPAARPRLSDFRAVAI